MERCWLFQRCTSAQHQGTSSTRKQIVPELPTHFRATVLVLTAARSEVCPRSELLLYEARTTNTITTTNKTTTTTITTTTTTTTVTAATRTTVLGNNSARMYSTSYDTVHYRNTASHRQEAVRVEASTIWLRT
ncbi:hypothetical protein E2C01_089511 [Portunus trituberculatus]|uniref:Uncharacterized protein n=1 Tax=Portunus trituberculatus TaxID=210409 RepID=A0A5B7JMM0_PORTR|nr:hypothetical protein [Portunus trituberculatus]